MIAAASWELIIPLSLGNTARTSSTLRHRLFCSSAHHSTAAQLPRHPPADDSGPPSIAAGCNQQLCLLQAQPRTREPQPQALHPHSRHTCPLWVRRPQPPGTCHRHPRLWAHHRPNQVPSYVTRPLKEPLELLACLIHLRVSTRRVRVRVVSVDLEFDRLAAT